MSRPTANLSKLFLFVEQGWCVILLFLFLLIFPVGVQAKTFSVFPPSDEDIGRAILEAAKKTHVRPALLYGLFGQETGLGRNLGKTGSQWTALCRSLNTQDCRYWKNYDCKATYPNSAYYEGLLRALGYVDASGRADKSSIPTSSTCAVGFTQFEPSTWLTVLRGRALVDKVYDPWNIYDSLLMAAYYLEDLGADRREELGLRDVIGSRDRVALQKYYCGAYYQRSECIAYAVGVESKARRTPPPLLAADLRAYLEQLERERRRREEERTRYIPYSSYTTTYQSTNLPVVGSTISSLPEGILESQYSAALSAQGGTPPYKWSITSGFLPDGLRLDPDIGVITGIPVSPGFFSFGVRLTDSQGYISQEKQLRIRIKIEKAELILVTNHSLPEAKLKTPYRVFLTAEGGTPPYSWRVLTEFGFPPGLSLDQASGEISGTPSEAVEFDFTVRPTDSKGVLGREKPFTIVVKEVKVDINEPYLPEGNPGSPYSAYLSARGGNPPYSWRVTSEYGFPPGLSLDSQTGAISGNPIASGEFNFPVRVTDSNGVVSEEKQFRILIKSQKVTVTTTKLPHGTVGIEYSAALSAQDGFPPYTWRLLAEFGFPPGLALDSRGSIFGNPTKAEIYSFTVRATDARGIFSEETPVRIIIRSPLVITTLSLSAGTAGESYQTTLQADGGITPYSWNIASGNLPVGITLDSSGTISGISSSTGSFPFTAEVVDADGVRALASFSLELKSAPPPLPSPPEPPSPPPPSSPPATSTATTTGALPRREWFSQASLLSYLRGMIQALMK